MRDYFDMLDSLGSEPIIPTLENMGTGEPCRAFLFDDPLLVLILACLAGVLVLAIVLHFASKARQQYSDRKYKEEVDSQLERLWGRVESMENSIEKLEKREDLETQVERLRQQNIRNFKLICNIGIATKVLHEETVRAAMKMLEE